VFRKWLVRNSIPIASRLLPPLTSLAPLSGLPHYSDSNGFSLALTSSSTAAGALQIKRDPRFSQDKLRN
jgi:hypothetical protein